MRKPAASVLALRTLLVQQVGEFKQNGWTEITWIELQSQGPFSRHTSTVSEGSYSPSGWWERSRLPVTAKFSQTLLQELALGLSSVTLSYYIIFLLFDTLTFPIGFCFTDTQTWLCFCFWLRAWGVSLCHSVCEAIGGLSQVSACLLLIGGSPLALLCARLPGLCASACPPVSMMLCLL